jgi:multisubunit Na+/H+ antiporter MnhG subunit
MYLARVLGATIGEVRDVFRASTPTHERLRDQLVGVALATIGIDLICALLAFLFERGAAQTQIKTLGSALFWTSTQLLTVSSSMQNPISTPGRVLDVAMEVYAITVVATLAGSLGAFLVKRGSELEEAAQTKSGRPRKSQTAGQ